MKKIEQKFDINLNDYTPIEFNTKEIIADLFGKTPMLSDVKMYTGIKANTLADVNVLTTDVTYDTSNCVADETDGNTNLTKISINVVRFSDREKLCADALDALMLSTPGAKNEELLFEEELIAVKSDANRRAIEKIVAQGDISNGDPIDGYYTQAVAGNAQMTTGVVSTPSTIIDDVEAMINARTDKAFEMGFDIYLSLAEYSMLVMALNKDARFVEASVAEDGSQSFNYPGLDSVIVKGTAGLTNGKKFGTTRGNLIAGTDLESDRENVEVFFDKVGKQVISDITFALGVALIDSAETIVVRQ